MESVEHKLVKNLVQKGLNIDHIYMHTGISKPVLRRLLEGENNQTHHLTLGKLLKYYCFLTSVDENGKCEVKISKGVKL